MSTFLSIIHVIACLFLILVVLLQQGKGGGLGGAFGGAGAQQVFGGRGAGNLLTRLTSICAAVFMFTSVTLAYLASAGDIKLRASTKTSATTTLTTPLPAPSAPPPAKTAEPTKAPVDSEDGQLETPLALDPDVLPFELTSLLGRGTRFEGKLFFEGRVRIDGAFRGEIRSNDTLVIGDGAEVDAQIDVANVIVRGGVVRGDIRARSSIELFVGATVVGNLHAPEIMLEKGVQFEGNCRMAPIEDATQGGLPDELIDRER